MHLIGTYTYYHEVRVSNWTKLYQTTKMSDLILFKTSGFFTIRQAVGPTQPYCSLGGREVATLTGVWNWVLKNHLMVALRIGGAITPAPTHTTSWRTRLQFHFTVYFSSSKSPKSRILTFGIKVLIFSTWGHQKSIKSVNGKLLKFLWLYARFSSSRRKIVQCIHSY